MGDSAGGGLSLALAEYFKAEGMRLPDELILLSPWVDVSMENEDIPKYQPKDPMIEAASAGAVAKRHIYGAAAAVPRIMGDVAVVEQNAFVKLGVKIRLHLVVVRVSRP